METTIEGSPKLAEQFDPNRNETAPHITKHQTTVGIHLVALFICLDVAVLCLGGGRFAVLPCDVFSGGPVEIQTFLPIVPGF